MAAGLAGRRRRLVWLTQIGVHTSYWTHVLPPEILMSLGLGLAFPALSSTALIKVHERDAGVASALVNTTQQVGGSLGTALLNTVAATATATYIAAPRSGLAPDAVVHGFSVAFALGAIIVAAGAIASAVLVNAKPADLVPTPEPARSEA